MDGPPFVESLIWAHVEALFWWRDFRKCVRYVGAVDEHVFTGGNRIE